jgi:hypothetical protein
MCQLMKSLQLNSVTSEAYAVRPFTLSGVNFRKKMRCLAIEMFRA